VSTTSPLPSTSDPRARILATTYELFSRRGIRAVGVDEIIETAGVAKATLYRHFPPKDDLVLAFLQRRDDVWTHGWVEREARSRADDSENQLLAIFDIFDEWFHSEDFEASVFINVLFEMGPSHPTGRASIHYLENIRGVVATMAAGADLRDPEAFARSWHILMQGSIVCAAEGDLEAATRAQVMGRTLIEQHRQQDTRPTVRGDQ
jgi:AcrR family transcriptional regulator